MPPKRTLTGTDVKSDATSPDLTSSITTSTTSTTSNTTSENANLISTDELEHLLAPQAPCNARIGTNIASRNPDVEIAALLLKDVPVTADSFRELAKDNDWYRFPFLVLQVGPAGFSTVPYTSTKKKGDKEEAGLSLYETHTDNHTMFHSFEKGKTNKDRGKRVSEVASTSDNTDAPKTTQAVSVVMQPGQCMAHFLRSDDFGGKFFVDSAETLASVNILPAYSVVYFQVSSSNIEQAKNGRLLKFKKMKIPSSPTEMGNILASSISLLPATKEEFKAVNECSESRNWSMRDNMEKGSLCFVAMQPSQDAFITDDAPPVFVQMDGNSLNAVMDDKSVLNLNNILPHASRTDKLKFLNLAMACNALKVLVRSNMQGDVVMDCNGEAFTHKVVAMHVDTNAMLALDKLRQLDLGALFAEPSSCLPVHMSSDVNDMSSMSSMFMLKGSKRDFAWGPASARIISGGKKQRIVFYVKEDGEHQHDAHAENTSTAFLDKNCAGPYVQLSVLIVDDAPHSAFSSLLEENTAPAHDLSTHPAFRQTCVTLELRPANRASAGGRWKRMRML